MQINEVNGVGTTTTSGAAATASDKAKLDYDAFLQLLVAEMNNQDPTQPMDATKYVSQLATFSQVEQAVNTNSKLDTMLASNELILAESLIGNRLTSADGLQSGIVKSVNLTDDGTVAVLENGTEVAVGTGVTIE